jgi:hypothetical protein
MILNNVSRPAILVTGRTSARFISMHDFFMPASVVFAIAGSLLFYLAAPGQRWLSAPLAPRLCRTLSAVFMCAAIVIGAGGLNPATSLAVVFTAAMVCLTACPFIGVVIGMMIARSPSQPHSSDASR